MLSDDSPGFPLADASLGDGAAAVRAALEALSRRDVIPRMWRRDHTVWDDDPVENANRLGWLDVAGRMRGQVGALRAFAAEVREAPFRHVVLLGMGGSSLGPEVMRQTFGSAAGHPELIVLDSTVPDCVAAVAEAIDPARTLFLVSSKSGTTTEPLAFYRYFRRAVEAAAGADGAGRNFVAVTDAGTPLERLAAKEGFRRVFLNPPDIGGRYSVLSFFGLVPAALLGMDVAALLDRAERMQARCAEGVPLAENHGAWLGATMAAFARHGRDKLTLVTSPGIRSFGLWAEQLVAESTGKAGKGIAPVAGEPLAEPASYGADRLFVYLRLDDAPDGPTDQAVGRIEAAGHPTVRLRLRDRLDLGAELYRWEFATAVAGALMGIRPFDQPDVQQAKDTTARLLAEHGASGGLSSPACGGSLNRLLAEARPGDYLALMSYVRQTPEVDAALAALRRRVMERHRIATTLGYGPRFLHSTGQLHKGGPNTGLFLQITAHRTMDAPVPGETYTFGALVDAQAEGDFQTLRARGRRVARAVLPAVDPAGAIEGLASSIE